MRRFSAIFRNATTWRLGESLAEGILTGQPEMPEFRFEPKEVDAILRDLQSPQVRRRGAAQPG